MACQRSADDRASDDSGRPAGWSEATHGNETAPNYDLLFDSTIVQRLDIAYGVIAHNYYLYGPPSAGGQLQWIPWDHNLSMAPQGTFGGPGAAAAPGTATGQSAEAEMFHTEIGESWPLIQLLLAEPVYVERYATLLGESLEGLFALERASARMSELHQLIAPYVVGPEGELPTSTTVSSAAAFEQSIDGEAGLVAHVVTRHVRVRAALEAK